MRIAGMDTLQLGENLPGWAPFFAGFSVEVPKTLQRKIAAEFISFSVEMIAKALKTEKKKFEG